MKKNHFRLLTVAAMLTATIGLSAQVRIGGRTPVTPGALLDLNSANKGILLYPRVSIEDLGRIPTSIGVTNPDSLNVNYSLAGGIVFNTNSTTGVGLYLWDGKYWLKIGTATAPFYTCDELYPALADNTGKTAQLVFGNATGDTLTFLTYNLGADPSLTPFQQMAYKYPWANTATDSALIPFDVRVNGGLFQWGRKDFRHAFRCPKETGVNDDKFSAENTQLNYPTVADDGKFVWGSGLSSKRWDWVTVRQDTLWDSSYSGYTGFNDPCPSGFHVPARSHWNTFINNSNICWFSRSDTYSSQRYVAIPVQNGVWKSNYKSDLLPAPNSNYLANNGIAIYEAADYNTLTFTGDGTDLTSPASFNNGTVQTPVLFLPAGGTRIGIDGGVSNTGGNGLYWSSTPVSDYNYRLEFSSNNVLAYNYDGRAFGLSVRCVKK